MESFAKRLRELRKEANLTQSELGRQVGISEKCISYWELNKHDIKSDRLIVLANFFNVRINYLLGVDNKKSRTD